MSSPHIWLLIFDIKKFLQDITLRKYFLIGGFSAVVDLSLFMVGKNLFNVHYLWIASFTFLIATFVNYVLCQKFLFIGNASSNVNRFLLVYGISLIGIAIHHSCLYVLMEIQWLSILFCKLIAICFAFIWNFLGRKFFFLHQRSI